MKKTHERDWSSQGTGNIILLLILHETRVYFSSFANFALFTFTHNSSANTTGFVFSIAEKKFKFGSDRNAVKYLVQGGIRLTD